MGAILIFVIVVAALTAFAILALRFGVDSRSASFDTRRPASPFAIN